jgi:mono/diheme cytochrome c family protein
MNICACGHHQELLSYVYEIKKMLSIPPLHSKLLDKKLPKLEIPIGQLAVIALAMLLIILFWLVGVHVVQASDPYVKSVLSLKGDVVQGHAIFQINCSGCHGLMADGRVGPSLHGISKRKSRYALINQVISGKTPPMPKFQPSPQEMADLLSYLQSL